MKTFCLGAVLLVGFASLSGCAQPTRNSGFGDSDWQSGTVIHVQLEGGFYGIVSDENVRYEPTNLPESFKQDGMRVRFRKEKGEDQMSFRMWGKVINLAEIEQIEGTSP